MDTGEQVASSPEQIERFRTRLREERSAAEARIRERESMIPATVRQDDELGDPADDAAALFERERLMQESQLDRELIERIDRALDRIQAGAYGISEVSGRPIPLERLEVVPWATTLVDEEPPADE